jgi:predicted RNA-binding protein with PUA-like domain
MAYWLLKTEPSEYSYDDLERAGRTAWDGVRNYQARNHLAAMRSGDRCFVYHSVNPKHIVGVARVVRAAYPEPGAKDPQWIAVDIEPVERLVSPIPLEVVKQHPVLSGMVLVRQSRLSVCPVSEQEWRILLAMGRRRRPGLPNAARKP